MWTIAFAWLSFHLGTLVDGLGNRRLSGVKEPALAACTLLRAAPGDLAQGVETDDWRSLRVPFLRDQRASPENWSIIRMLFQFASRQIRKKPEARRSSTASVRP